MRKLSLSSQATKRPASNRMFHMDNSYHQRGLNSKKGEQIREWGRTGGVVPHTLISSTKWQSECSKLATCWDPRLLISKTHSREQICLMVTIWDKVALGLSLKSWCQPRPLKSGATNKRIECKTRKNKEIRGETTTHSVSTINPGITKNLKMLTRVRRCPCRLLTTAVGDQWT